MSTAALRTYLTASRLSARGPIDWDAAPPRFKLYPDAPRILLPPNTLGALLRDLCGVTRMIWMPTIDHQGHRNFGQPKVQYGRSAPSGGALYPLDTYVALGRGELEPALYHYDSAHHCLELLRPGDHRTALLAQIENSPPAPAAVLVFATRFWRNGFKYGEFAYRLQTQEIGVLAAQAATLATALGTTATLHLDFPDNRINALLGFAPNAEAALAICTVGTAEATEAGPTYKDLTTRPLPAPNDPPPPITDRLPATAALHTATTASHPVTASAADLGGDGGALDAGAVDLGGDTAASYAGAADLVAAAAASAAASAAPGGAPTPISDGESLLVPVRSISLPRNVVALSAGIAGRSSPADGFYPTPVAANALSALLQAAADHASTLYCLINRVDGIPSGGYRYHRPAHSLFALDGPFTPAISCHPTVGEAAAVLVPVGDLYGGTAAHGPRWYRIQQAAVGAILQRAALAATVLGLATRIHSGEDPDFGVHLGCRGDRMPLSALLIGVPRRVSTLEQRIGAPL
ncbi:SagB family peptide dehydrogenase [Nocardia sp. NPDC051832]|uniref:SagB family peptide dehydrogenase n=1 Tax=Nocardia sp. NPDC051832 TaxID=3155673 RepID=UPI00344022B3